MDIAERETRDTVSRVGKPRTNVCKFNFADGVSVRVGVTAIRPGGFARSPRTYVAVKNRSSETGRSSGAARSDPLVRSFNQAITNETRSRVHRVRSANGYQNDFADEKRAASLPAERGEK